MLNLGILGRIGSFRREREKHLDFQMMDVKFIVNEKMYIGNWNGRSHNDLKRAFFEAFGLGRAARCPALMEQEKKAQKALQRALGRIREAEERSREREKKIQFEAKCASSTHPNILRENKWKKDELDRCRKRQDKNSSI